MRFLDTDVMVDILRANQKALEWLDSLDEAPGLVGFVSMELMQGCKDKGEMNRLINELQPFVVHWPSDAACGRALHTYARTHLSHGVGILDALIGECAVERQAVLCTFNHRHFKGIENLETEQPYERK
ncbi:MAG TPA: PIN domain-containing protein [Myxococcota bacterium]|nr:PIN domain-containing protein [Myxococcota bacterium]